MSTESKHTRGPWYRVSYGGYHSLQPTPYYDDNNDLLNEDHYVNAEANATLAAAAPDLLKACEKAVEMIKTPDGPGLDSVVNVLLEAIKKAKGI